MNLETRLTPKHWKQIIGIILVLAIAGYQYAQPTLEKWFDVKLPSITSQDAQQQHFPAASPKSTRGSAPTGYLKDIGRNRFQSPAGLLYTMGPNREHRIDHILRHAEDESTRPVHSVFDGSREEILATIDEAYELVKAKSPRVRSSRSDGNDEYKIRMNRKVGYEGGQGGKRKGYPPLTNIKLILDGNRIITAYPFR